jgi:hypothetical protein
MRPGGEGLDKPQSDLAGGPMQGYTSWDAHRLTFIGALPLGVPLGFKQAEHPIKGLACGGVLVQDTRFSQGCGDIGEVGHVGAADHRFSQSRRL